MISPDETVWAKASSGVDARINHLSMGNKLANTPNHNEKYNQQHPKTILQFASQNQYNQGNHHNYYNNSDCKRHKHPPW